MDWKYEPETKSWTYKEYNGAVGYTVMPYNDKYAVYVHNGWRTDKPLGEYLTNQAELSYVYSPPSLGLPPELLCDTPEQGKQIAEQYCASGQEPMSYSGVEEEY